MSRGQKLIGALGLALSVLIVAAVLLMNSTGSPDPPFEDPEELAAAISDVDGYECETNDVTTDTVEFEGGSAETRLCTLYRDGKDVFGDGGALRLVVVSPPEAMADFVRLNRREAGTPAPAIVGQNWVIPGPAGDDEQVRADLLGGLEGAREGSYGVADG